MNLLPNRKHPCLCQAELHVPPEAAGQERQLHLAQLKTVMDTGQTNSGGNFITHLEQR